MMECECDCLYESFHDVPVITLCATIQRLLRESSPRHPRLCCKLRGRCTLVTRILSQARQSDVSQRTYVALILSHARQSDYTAIITSSSKLVGHHCASSLASCCCKKSTHQPTLSHALQAHTQQLSTSHIKTAPVYVVCNVIHWRLKETVYRATIDSFRVFVDWPDVVCE